MIDQHASLAEKFLRKGFWLYLFSFIIAPMGYMIKILISGEISIESVGVLYGVLSLITLLGSLNDLGFTESFKYFIPKYFIKKKYNKIKSLIFFAFLFQLITSIILSSLFFFGADILGEYYFKTESATSTIKIFSIFFIAYNIFQLLNTFFLAVQNTFLHKITDFFRLLFILLGCVGIVFFDISSLENFSLSWTIGLFFGLFISIIIFLNKYYKIYFKNSKIIFSRKFFSEIFKYSIISFLGMQTTMLLSQIDMQMVLFMLGAEQGGYYTTYLSIISIPVVLVGPILYLFFPLFSELNSNKKQASINIIKEKYISYFIPVILFLSLFIFMFSEHITYTLFGEKFLYTALILKYSVILLMFNFLYQINANILVARGDVNKKLYIVIVAVIVNIITNYIFINLLGSPGAALATGIGWIIIWIISEIFLSHIFRLKINYVFIFKNLCIVILLSYVFFNMLNFSYLENSRFIVGIKLFLFAIVFHGLYFVINIKDFKKIKNA